MFPFYLSVCLFICFSICLFICLFICLVVCLFVCLLNLSICLSVFLSVYLFIYLFICLFVCLFVFISLLVCLTICLSTCLLVCLISSQGVLTSPHYFVLLVLYDHHCSLIQSSSHLFMRCFLAWPTCLVHINERITAVRRPHFYLRSRYLNCLFQVCLVV